MPLVCLSGGFRDTMTSLDAVDHVSVAISGILWSAAPPLWEKKEKMGFKKVFIANSCSWNVLMPY